jgi:DNA polymerase-3 subunit epsilon
MLSNLKLNRPIVFFDLETTGVSPVTDRVVELCAVKVHPDGKRESILHVIDPTIPIPKEASDVHGFTDEKVKGKPTFAQLAKELHGFFTGCDLGGYNIASFDIPLIAEEFCRASLFPPFDKATRIADGLKIYFAHEKRDLTSAYRFYCNKTLEGAHSAEADVLASMEVLNTQVSKYELGNQVDGLHGFLGGGNDLVDFAGKFARNESGVVVLTFGKNAGKRATDDKGYLEWMLKSDFPMYTKYIINKLLKGEEV